MFEDNRGKNVLLYVGGWQYIKHYLLSFTATSCSRVNSIVRAQKWRCSKSSVKVGVTQFTLTMLVFPSHSAERDDTCSSLWSRLIIHILCTRFIAHLIKCCFYFIFPSFRVTYSKQRKRDFPSVARQQVFVKPPGKSLFLYRGGWYTVCVYSLSTNWWTDTHTH